MTPGRRAAAIPDEERRRPKWEMALEMIDEFVDWGRTVPPPAGMCVPTRPLVDGDHETSRDV